MATPRKHWFRVADSIGRDPLTNDELATAIRLMCALNTRWARDGLTAEQATRIVLSPGEMMALTGRKRLDYARLTLSLLAVKVSIAVSFDGAYSSIEWPKWSDFQELPALTEGNSKATYRPRNAPSAPSPSPSPATSPAREEERAPSAPPAPRTPTRGMAPCPDELDLESKLRLTSWAADRGITPDQIAYGWDFLRDWARSRSKRQSDWEAAFRNALRKGWCLEGYGAAGGKPAERESAAEAKVRRTKDAARRVLDRVTSSPNPFALIPGGNAQ